MKVRRKFPSVITTLERLVNIPVVQLKGSVTAEAQWVIVRSFTYVFSQMLLFQLEQTTELERQMMNRAFCFAELRPSVIPCHHAPSASL